MSRTSIFARRATPHVRDERIKDAVKVLLSKIYSKVEKIQWYGSRESDVIRFEAIVDGFAVKLSRYFPPTDKDYLAPIHGGLSTREDELIIEVRDSGRRWNRNKVLYECFDRDSSLYDDARTLFDVLQARFPVKNTYLIQDDRLSYLDVIKKFTSIFTE